jgi:DNA polymerase III delta subunit
MQVRSALDLGQNNRKIQTKLKLHPFVVSKVVTQVRNFQLNSLKEIFKSLTRIDQRLKTGRGDLKIDLDLLITAM